MINESSDSTVALRHAQQAALTTPPASGQINLVQATNVANNLTPAEFLITSSSAASLSQPQLVVASTSNFPTETGHESAAVSWALSEKALLQFTAAPADPLLRQRSASSPQISASEHAPGHATISASAPTYLSDAANIYHTIPAAKKTIKNFASPFELLRATIAENLTVKEKQDEQQKKLSVLDRLLEKRRPGIRLELCDLDLSGLNLSTLSMPLDNIHFINCQLHHAQLPGILNNCQLTECEADNISLSNVVLTGCGIISSRFNRAQLLSTQFINCTLSYVEMRSAQATAALFSDTVLTACNWSGATLTLCKFPGATLANNIWKDTTTSDNVFNGATLIGSFHGANFSDDSMRKVTIAGADFAGVILADNCTLAPPTAAQLQRYFDPDNPLSVRLLNAIHSSEEGELAIKTRLVRQLITPLDLTSIVVPAEVAKALLATLVRPPYRDDRRIYPFIMALLPHIEPVSAISFLSAQELITWRNALAILRAPADLSRRVHEEHRRNSKLQVFDQMVNRSRNGNPLIIHGVNIHEITFDSWHFTRLDLSFGDFSRSQFHNCTFTDCQLRSALLQKCYFINCTFTGQMDMSAADLTDAAMVNCKFNGLEASRIILTRARLENVKIKDANLTGAEMSGSYLINCNLTGSDLSCATLRYARLVTTFMINTLMVGSSLEECTLYNVMFTGADLSAARMEQIDLINASFTDCQLSENLTIVLPPWDDTLLERYLDHFLHPEGSLPETLRTIPDKYSALKITLAEQLVSSLQASDIALTPYIKPLIDIFGREFWRQSSLIQAFDYQLIEQHFTTYDLSALPQLGARVSAAILENLRDNLSLAYSHQNAFTQLINQAVFIEQRGMLQELAQRVYEDYLQLPAFRRALEQRNSVQIVNNVRTSEADWSDNQAANFVLISRQPDGPLMLISGENLLLMLNTVPTNWSSFWLFNHGRVLELENYTTAHLVEHHFPMFHDAWLAQQHLNPLQRLVAALNPGDDLSKLFMHAFSQPVSNQKLTEFASLQALESVFLPLMEFAEGSSRECSMTEQHYQVILNLYALTDASDREKAETFFCIAIIFTRLSSATHLGNEGFSPHLIRFYASTCITKAHELVPDMFVVAPHPTEVAPSIDYYVEWKERLLGTAQPVASDELEGMAGAAAAMPPAEAAEPAEAEVEAEADEELPIHCSDTLATHMLGLARMVCPETAKRFYPLTWNE